MKALRLDFAPPPRRQGVAWLLLAAAAFVAGDSTWRALALQEDVAREEQLLRERRPEFGRTRANEAVVSNPETARALQHADQVARQLALPWDKLFRSIEAATSDRVGLLAVEPDATRALVSISGEAVNHQAVIDYLARLNASNRLHGVHLVRHEIRTGDPRRPVAFTLQAQWSRAP